MLCFKLNKCIILNVVQTVRTIRSVHQFILSMDKAYFYYNTGENQFNVTFLYEHKEANVKRQFNFTRTASETIEAFTGRITTNIEKIVNRKFKRQNKHIENESVGLLVQVVSDGLPLNSSLTCQEVFFKQNYPTPLVLKVGEINYSIIINCPWIDVFALPKRIMSGYPVYPCKFEVKFVDKSKSSFSWLRSNKLTDSNKKLVSWEEVGNTDVYLTSQKDIGCKLKLICTPRNKSMEGPPAETISDNLVENGPKFCPFENRHKFTKTNLEGNSFRVITYNILADLYADSDDARNLLFPYCEKHALTIEYRKPLFIKEIMGYNADIICLQEVDSKVYDVDFTTVFGRKGFEGHFAKKDTVSEGLVCLYSTSRFKKIESHIITYGEELKTKKNYCSHIWKIVHENSNLSKRICELGTCGQVVVLKSLDLAGEILVVGNTHLYFHPNADHIRLLQAGVFVAFLQQVVESIAKKNPAKHVSLLICGDYNSVAECGIYKLMTTKEVPDDFVDWKSKEDEAVKGLSLRQPFSLASACGTPKYTNYTVGFADCLDYIFYQVDRLKVEQVIPMPTEQELKQHSAIPSIVFPSDHIALVADLKWR
uniref:2',5'-phosphodiesterase 12 n=1 Tax=Clastoptera arizonana TaxID=38151 RepID=A0A1B6D1I8_9HEMI